jgi:four helix bundle protein
MEGVGKWRSQVVFKLGQKDNSHPTTAGDHMPINTYKDLVVWAKALDMVELTYRLTAALPKEEEFGLKAQMRRAAVSIPSNIAEGQSREHTQEFIRFLHISLGSLSELHTQHDVCLRLKMLTASETVALVEDCDQVGKMLRGLIKSLRAKNKSKSNH